MTLCFSENRNYPAIKNSAVFGGVEERLLGLFWGNYFTIVLNPQRDRI